MIHTASWPKGYNQAQWQKEKVAVIGSGASSIQTVPGMQVSDASKFEVQIWMLTYIVCQPLCDTWTSLSVLRFGLSKLPETTARIMNNLSTINPPFEKTNGVSLSMPKISKTKSTGFLMDSSVTRTPKKTYATLTRRG